MTHASHASASRHNSSKLRKDARQNRNRLLTAAREVFAERGLDVSMDVIAHRAGLGTGTAYRHFANKYELANAIFDDVVERLVDSAEKVDDDTADAWTALCRIVEQLLEAQSRDRGIREMILVSNQDSWAHHDSLLAPLQAAFERAQHDQLIRANAAFTDLVIMLIMLCSLTEHAGADAPTLWRRYLPTMLHGLASSHVVLPDSPMSDDRLHAALTHGLLRYQSG